MFVMMAIGLYTSSVMHNVLGLEDSDTYNIVDSGEGILNTQVFLTLLWRNLECRHRITLIYAWTVML